MAYVLDMFIFKLNVILREMERDQKKKDGTVNSTEN